MVGDRTSISFKVCAVFCATSLAIAAAETSPPPPAEPLAAAKRDYEAFKARGTQVGQQGGMNLRRSLPPLETTGDAPPMPSPIQRARRIESVRAQRSAARSENWLIDGVRNNSGSSAARFGFSRRDESAEEQGASTLERSMNSGSIAAGAGERGSTRAHEVESTQKNSADRSIEAYNPLDNYMSKWMTPEDFERLKSSPDHSGPGGSMLGSAWVRPSTSVPFAPVSVAMQTSGDIGFDERTASLGLKSDNPYIKELAMPVAPMTSPSAPELPQPVSPNLMPAMPARSPITHPLATPPAKPSLAEALKAGDEARFFKQLKRF